MLLVFLCVCRFGPHIMYVDVLQKLKDRNIEVLCMPSHTSHILQVLDVTCFGPTKRWVALMNIL